MTSRFLRFCAAAAAGLCVPLIATAAYANTAGCSASSHCYSILNATGTTYYGMYGTWNRAAMAAGSPTVTNQRFINSEMWFGRGTASTAPWVEVGMKDGYFAGTDSVGHRVFGEWNNAGAVGFHNFGTFTSSDTVTDEFQISRAGTTNSWRVYWDGTYWTTGTGPGFWSGSNPQMGAEVATAYATSHQFTMYGKGLNSSGTRVNFGTDAADANNNTTVLSGSRPADSTWQWKVIG